MLSKLIKHEWKETWKIPALTCIVILFMTLISVICFSRMEPPTAAEELNFGAFFLFMGFTLMISSLSLVIQIYFAVRYYKNLYSDEGYLMHTLPVTARQLILSKMFIASLWFCLLSLLVIWAVFAVMAFCIPVMVGPEEFFSAGWFFNIFPSLFGMSMPAFAVFYLVTIIISSFSGTLIIYASISLGQLFSKHKVMAAILCYIGYNMLVSTITSVAMTPFLAKMVISSANSAITTNSLGLPDFFGPFMRNTMIISVVCSVVIGIISYILSEYIMKKQLNLD